MASTLSEITEIRPESARYADDSLWYWYVMYAARAWKKALLYP